MAASIFSALLSIPDIINYIQYYRKVRSRQMELKRSVERQFAAVAANYASHPVMARGPELGRMVELGVRSGAERVLDLGCGAGHTALAFAPHVAEVVAVDLAEAMLAQGRRLACERGIGNVDFRLGDVERLDLPDSSFDVATSRFSAHHYPAPERALAEVVRVLRPGGAFLLVDSVAPEAPGCDTFLNAIEVLRDPSHVRDHRVSEWEAMFAAAGLAPVLQLRWAIELDFDSWVERIGTPDSEIGALRRMLDRAPAELREALVIGSPGPHDFSIPVALLQGS
jgi:ubiquinone/menaquinone biosynthesis C-methylase UbiE